MGFFCYSCNKKVRGQPVKHPCTRKKFGRNANGRVYDHSGGKGHRLSPADKGMVCFAFRDQGKCTRKKCCYKHKGVVCVKQELRIAEGTDLSGGNKHRSSPADKGMVCFAFRDQGKCTRKNCFYKHESPIVAD